MHNLMRQALTGLGAYVASPIAFFVVVVYVALWWFLKPDSLDWHAGATIATWFMTLVIQRAEHRDTQAIHAKLDEIVHALGGARDEVAHIDDQEPEEIEEHRDEMRRKAEPSGS
jgi:low affinity Fe/Cu permease